MLEAPERVKAALSGPEVHEGWERTYQSLKNERFWDDANDWLSTAFELGPCARILDVGCGTGRHGIRFARRGFETVACDFSYDRVASARANAAAQGVRIEICAQDVTSLGFRHDTFEAVLCWGVLMHVPEIGKGITELVRVTKIGGKIVLYENNVWSLESLVLRIAIAAKMALGNSGTRRRSMTRFGLESWVKTPREEIIIRQSRIGELVRVFERLGCRLRARRAGQFTEMYRFFPGTMIESALQSFDNFWFSKIRWPQLAYGNLLVFERDFVSHRPAA